MFATITDRLGKREPVKLENFGKFKVRRQKGRRGRRPSTGGHISIPARWIVRFLPSKILNNLPTDQVANPHPAGAPPMKPPL
jgi:nucleoid DNA-binding protein